MSMDVWILAIVVHLAMGASWRWTLFKIGQVPEGHRFAWMMKGLLGAYVGLHSIYFIALVSLLVRTSRRSLALAGIPLLLVLLGVVGAVGADVLARRRYVGQR